MKIRVFAFFVVLFSILCLERVLCAEQKTKCAFEWKMKIRKNSSPYINNNRRLHICFIIFPAFVTVLQRPRFIRLKWINIGILENYIPINSIPSTFIIHLVSIFLYSLVARWRQKREKEMKIEFSLVYFCATTCEMGWDLFGIVFENWILIFFHLFVMLLPFFQEKVKRRWEGNKAKEEYWNTNNRHQIFSIEVQIEFSIRVRHIRKQKDIVSAARIDKHKSWSILLLQRVKIALVHTFLSSESHVRWCIFNDYEEALELFHFIEH